MYIKRTGKSLESCSRGFFYKVIGTDKTRFFISDNNGVVIPVRQNSKHWTSNCEVDMTRVGSHFNVEGTQTGRFNSQEQNKSNTLQQPSQSSSSDDSLIYAAVAFSLLS